MSAVSSRECALLLACSRPSLDDSSTETVRRLLTEGPDWTELVSLALEHGVTAALYRAAADRSIEPLVPPEILVALRQYCDSARERNEYLATELAEIVSALERGGVTAVPFKGPLLAEQLYGDLGQRPPGDIDFFVRPRDVTAACDLLVSRGYRDRYASDITLTATQHRIYRRYQCEYQFIRDNDGTVAEPHWAAVPRMRAVDLDYEAQFARARRVAFAGTSVWAHAPEDLLLILSAHGAKHEWWRLCWLRDLAAMIEHRERLGLDVDHAVSRARKHRQRRLVLLGLSLVHRLLEVRLPPASQAAIQHDRGVGRLTDVLAARLFDRNRPELREFRLNAVAFRTHEELVSRTRYVLRTLLLPRREHIEMVALPAFAAWLYYPVRWGHDYVALPLWLLARPFWKRRRSAGPA